MERTLSYRCPTCKRKLAAVPGVQVATQVVRRKCGGCGDRWQIVVVPSARETRLGEIWFDAGTFVKISPTA
jgi:transcription elongation factor Elf1